MHMPKRKKSKVDVPEVDKAVHQTVDVPESSDVVLPDDNADQEDNAVNQTVNVPESSDVVLPDDSVVLEYNAVPQTVDVPESSDVVLPDDSVVLEYNAVPQTVNVPESSDVVLPDDNVVLEDNAVRQTVDVPESSDVVLMQDNNANVVSKCHVFGCNEKVFLACPTCLEFLCYEHKDSECVEHASTYVVLDGVICTDGYVTVVTETGEFQVPVESPDCSVGSASFAGNDNNIDHGLNAGVSPDCSVGSASFAGNENNTDHGLNAGVKHKTNTRKKKKSPHLWKCNVQKENHLKGKQYYTYRGAAGSACVPAKCPQLCNCQKCRFHCSDIFSDEDRQSICDEFYQLGSYSRQKDFVINHVVENKTRHR